MSASASSSPWRYRSILELPRVRRLLWHEEMGRKSNFRGYIRLCLVYVTSTIILVLLIVHYAGHAGWARPGSLSFSKKMVQDTNGEIWPSEAARERLLPPRVVVGQPWSRTEKIATAAGEGAGSERDVIVTRYLGEKENSPLVDSQIHHGLSIHGHRMDAMYEYETSDLGVYLTTLETFIRDHLPTRDSDEDDPSSLINAMRAYFPLKEQRSQKQPIPFKLFRTGKTFQTLMAGKYLSSFNRLNPGLNTTSHWDAAADTWARDRFEFDRNQETQGKQGIVEAWDSLRPQKPVLKADFWRYLIVASEGGWYADEDLEALRPFAEWGLPQGVDEQKPLGFTEASLVVGIEADLLHYPLWATRFARPIQIVQWGFGAARGHPVTIDAMRRAYNKTMKLKPGRTVDILLTTGPGPWTSAVFGWLLARNGRTWVDFHGVPYPGWRHQDLDTGELGDIRIMPLTAMTPDRSPKFYPGSRGRDHYAAMSVHHFDGSWRDKRPSGKAPESQGAKGPSQPRSKSTRA